KGVVAGIDYAKKIFALEGSKSNIKKEDGSVVLGGQTIMTVSGNARQILACERTALNLLSRMSGIATQTRKIAKKISRYKAKLYATRKTAPGLRIFDKEAVKIGGGEKHRLGLDDMIMIKDNHIAAAGGSIVELIRKAKRKGYKEIEVEVENQSNAVVAAKEGATIIMLDNFTPLQIKKTILKLRKERLREKVKVEASG
ncbi:MAG: carboxylating nicotinate-nucleotide diphosphorylase, partial [Nitrosopumilaceae archaeon]|nr:carboxylating nicotinate-nucleotide diphosphorylase [Nitrosopumilaceae archaeon]NIU86839.1 carboxylating nicotinate-nucleotide diphosphorylase [Nitrosopumilaceae archaeon]NIV65497.1 carboxylating nicotinate-nucleotide diphosphorylase [Nitrosopumilaceae archaeon]NIX61833.1 carboxylating nicotinate-nucleotide diphosphorylase [Nitrosopumilaceae archaeon]